MAVNDGPAVGAAAVTPSDSARIAETRGLYLGAAGDVKVEMADGTIVMLTALAAGVLHPLRVRRVYSTGTTATGIVAIY